MKKLTLIGLLASTLILNATDILLVWDKYNTNAFPNSYVWVVYTTNSALPVNQWKAWGPVLNPTNYNATQQGIWITNLTMGNYFFSACWTNTFWHNNSPFFSPPTATPAIATNLVNNLDIPASNN